MKTIRPKRKSKKKKEKENGKEEKTLIKLKNQDY